MPADPAYLYRLYLLGCRSYEWMPVSEEEFSRLAARYEKCRGTIHFCRKRLYPRAAHENQENRFLRAVAAVMNEFQKLQWLPQAVAAGARFGGGGSRGDAEGGAGHAGVPAVPPFHPTLVGSAAKLPPHLDPEPDVRDYVA